ncbi:hypothetical protein HG536_0D04290 [Torulaspora globosa]|uniref:GOLD domain-containing protein n=1 Tax=Torulaspora globosa TaxID=48254 RepID=A0A7G3ZHC1_9SACH|nr:uncharacterized protein HG536_0D04290 [Torulaspora globosa]QLL32907.1 hypothetical protein HG536_0D04290 [Torulaspora globosa]
MLCAVLIQLAFFLAVFPSKVSAFYFYGNGGERKCFHKELSKGTLLQGRYNVQIFDEKLDSFRDAIPQEFDVLVDIDETFDDMHRVSHQKGSPRGEISFNALDSGEHRICIQPQATRWLNKGRTKVELEFEVGADTKLDSKQRSTVESLQSKIEILNEKVMEIRREQKLVRDREAKFRNASEAVNSRAMWWSIVQLIVLGITCAWQMRHLRSFFVKQKVL